MRRVELWRRLFLRPAVVKLILRDRDLGPSDGHVTVCGRGLLPRPCEMGTQVRRGSTPETTTRHRLPVEEDVAAGNIASSPRTIY